MSSELRDTFRAFRFSFICLIALGYIGFVVPPRIGIERHGIRRDGIIVRYERSASGRYEYPVVRINRYDQIVEVRSSSSWRFEWYHVGDHVPVLDVGGPRVLVGSALVRWGDAILIFLGVGVSAAFLSYRPKRKPKPLAATATVT